MTLALVVWIAVSTPVLDTPGYDYHPAGIDAAIFTCSPAHGGDAIYRNGVPVLVRSANPAAADSRHACAPAVVASQYPALVAWVRRLSGTRVTKAWLLYYECEPLATDGHPSICVAVSHNQVRWWRWDGRGFAGPAQPIIVSEPTSDWYGAGHPSAMVLPDGRIRLTYYDWDGTTSYHVADSWAGLHVWTVADWALPVPPPGPGVRVQRFPDGRYLVLGVIDNANGYTVGDGVTWQPWTVLGQSVPAHWAAPARAAVVANERGEIPFGVPVRLLSAEYLPGPWWWLQGAAIYAMTGKWQ